MDRYGGNTLNSIRSIRADVCCGCSHFWRFGPNSYPLNYFYFNALTHYHIIIIMKKQLVALALLLIAANAVINDGTFASCPVKGVPAVAGSLTISSNGDIGLQNSVDVQCYNHTLTQAFDCPPSVAIGNR